MAEVSDVTTLLVRFLKDASPRPVKGSTLAGVVMAQVQDFSPAAFGCKSFGEFVRKYAANDIAVVDRAGMDVLYGLRSEEQQHLFHAMPPPARLTSQSQGPLGQLRSNRRIWKTFVTPDSSFHLFINPENGQIRCLAEGVSAPAAWKEIPRIPAESLLQFAKEFVDNQTGETARVQLQPILSDSKWWIPFFEMLQTLGLKTRWVMYRRKRIEDEFAKILSTLQVADGQNTGVQVQTPAASGHEDHGQAPREDLTRRVAADVVQRMTDAELRMLNLPLGYVIDAIKTR